MIAKEALFESLRLELRRGSLILAVLAQLRREQYGYSLRMALSQAGVEMEESTLYPLLRRLESQGLLVSEWREEEKRKKRFYQLSVEGEEMLARLAAEWRALSASVEGML
ncbi:PadR family transcriptional regulator [Brevundimonas sp.]|uniref:PadR family transcriptional regulator n=1 Tax=Brevundimonas sp. TaxID=1871086 RepID=UPI003FA60A87